jgi:hypothetical protein
MCESKQLNAKHLAAFADALDSMDEHDLDLLIQGKATLRLVKIRKLGKKPIDDSPMDEAVSEMAQNLKNAESREAAESLLASIEHPRRKEFLLLLAKACGVKLRAKDSVVMIKRSLIEDVVGTRLSSKAIQKVAF